VFGPAQQRVCHGTHSLFFFFPLLCFAKTSLNRTGTVFCCFVSLDTRGYRMRAVSSFI
jgi:hypothetical protein